MQCIHVYVYLHVHVLGLCCAFEATCKFLLQIFATRPALMSTHLQSKCVVNNMGMFQKCVAGCLCHIFSPVMLN